MSIFDKASGVLGGIFRAATSSAGLGLISTVVSGFLTNKTNNSAKKKSESRTSGTPLPTLPYTDPGVREQVTANQKNRVPLVYGSAQLGGIITDAEMSNSNQTMHYCLTICEMTGTKLSDSQASTFTFEDVYWNDQRIIFDSDGQTAAYSVDRDGNRDYSIDGLVKVYCYNGASTAMVVPDNYTNGTTTNAYDVMPSWTSAHAMNDLVFAIVEVNYNKEKGVTGLPQIRFHVTNSMTLAGDCMLDYMTSTRYGAAIPQAEIYDE